MPVAPLHSSHSQLFLLSGTDHLRWSTTSTSLNTLYLRSPSHGVKSQIWPLDFPVHLLLLVTSLPKWFSNCSDTSSEKCFVYLWRLLFTDFLALIYWGSEINFIEKEFSSLQNLRDLEHDLMLTSPFSFFLTDFNHTSNIKLLIVFQNYFMDSCSLPPFGLECCYSPPPHWTFQTSLSGSCSFSDTAQSFPV